MNTIEKNSHYRIISYLMDQKISGKHVRNLPYLLKKTEELLKAKLNYRDDEAVSALFYWLIAQGNGRHLPDRATALASDVSRGLIQIALSEAYPDTEDENDDPL